MLLSYDMTNGIKYNSIVHQRENLTKRQQDTTETNQESKQTNKKLKPRVHYSSGFKEGLLLKANQAGDPGTNKLKYNTKCCGATFVAQFLSLKG